MMTMHGLSCRKNTRLTANGLRLGRTAYRSHLQPDPVTILTSCSPGLTAGVFLRARNAGEACQRRILCERSFVREVSNARRIQLPLVPWYRRQLARKGLLLPDAGGPEAAADGVQADGGAAEGNSHKERKESVRRLVCHEGIMTGSSSIGFRP